MPESARRGCGEGALARQLARLAAHIVGIDQDAASIDLAHRQDPDGEIGFIRADFLADPSGPASLA
jgi:2-polyprenyl-3-methyl-5-hydroxy-6-metoxy-1,4-benzoquinol methylase